MEQLSGLDATFLYFETAQTPMHVAGLTTYDLPKGFRGSFHKHFATFFAGRVHLVPIFSKRLAKTVLELDHPGWVDAGEPDLDYHIQSVKLDKPGSHEQLEAMVAKLHAEPLDRSKPLWQFTVIEGVGKSADGNRQAALYSKVHHAAIDGGAGMAIAMALYDFTQEPRKVDVPERAPRKAAPSIPERAVLGVHDLVANAVTQQLKLAEALPKVMGAMLEGAAKLANADPKRALMPQLVAPKTPFNATMGRGRSYAARSVALDGAKAIGKASGAKLNDVVMAISAGALRAYLKEKDKLPSQPLVAFVPISLREAGDASANNQVSGMNVPLATDIADPKKRLAAIVVNSGERKDVAEVGKGAALSDFTLLGAPMMLPGLMKAFGRTGLADIMPSAVNLCISNTMGPPVPLYCAGAKVTALYPVSIATHGVGLNITVQSYNGALDFGVTAGAKAVPDADHFGDLLVQSYDELRAVFSV